MIANSAKWWPENDGGEVDINIGNAEGESGKTLDRFSIKKASLTTNSKMREKNIYFNSNHSLNLFTILLLKTY